MSSIPAVLLFLSAAIPFIYSSSLNADTNDGFPTTVGSVGHLGFVASFLGHWRADGVRLGWS